MVKIQNPFRRFWDTDRGLSILLIVLLAMIFAVPVLGLTGHGGRLVIDALFTLLMLAGVSAISKQRTAMVVVSVFAVAGLAVRWFGRALPYEAVEVAVPLAGMVSVVMLAYVVLTQVFRAGKVNRHRIMGAIAVYLLFGMAWGEAYLALDLWNPGSFSTAAGVARIPESWMYFSFVTLTTVGYGDITPVSSLARALAVLEALTGQLYPAILLARLVALEVNSNADRGAGDQ